MDVLNVRSIDETIRAHRTPDVPGHLLLYTCGRDSMDEYVRGGAEVFTMLDLAARRYAGRPLPAFSNILDFGCGCGRQLRFLDASNVCACDVNEELIGYVTANFPNVSAHRSGLMPPLDYQDGRFDLIYSFSVFSHLSQPVEDAWLRELARVGAPDCLYLLTVHGDWMIDQTLGDQADAAREAGFFWRQVHQRHGTPNDFPDYYEASYHTSSYIEREWAKYLDIRAVIKGDAPFRYALPQQEAESLAVLLQIRPMGQDLVVARKRGTEV